MEEAFVNINGEGIETLEILFMLTLLSLIPSIVVMGSSFTRIVIVVSFLRNAMGIQQVPPNMIVTGMALFLSFYIMTPTIDRINDEAYTPYKNEVITQEQALENAVVPMKEFMLQNTEMDTLTMFMDFSQGEPVEDVLDLPLTVIVPSFITSELARAFLIGFLVFMPFLLIDIIVACTLMSMGMMMLPPSMISLPFKLLLFVTVDGWHLLFSALISSFRFG
ncbi:MAG: flagellar type III secretion system pore protein FliP [Bacillota bacterium]